MLLLAIVRLFSSNPEDTRIWSRFLLALTSWNIPNIFAESHSAFSRIRILALYVRDICQLKRIMDSKSIQYDVDTELPYRMLVINIFIITAQSFCQKNFAVWLTAFSILQRQNITALFTATPSCDEACLRQNEVRNIILISERNYIRVGGGVVDLTKNLQSPRGTSSWQCST